MTKMVATKTHKEQSNEESKCHNSMPLAFASKGGKWDLDISFIPFIFLLMVATRFSVVFTWSH